MKTIISFLVILITSACVLSCDYVNNTVQPTNTNTVSPTNPSIVYKKAFLEKYTGHKCGNCPAASDVSNALQLQYPNKIVALSIHAGFFSTTGSSYPTDFRTTAGNTYDTHFGISVAGNPNGLTNRLNYNQGNFIKSPSVWGSEVSQIINQQAKFEIKINTNFNSATSSLNTNVTLKSLAENNGSYKLVVLLSEDSIVAEQIDYRLPAGNQLVTNYVFRHVLRGAINSEWGDVVFATTANANDSVIKSYTNYSINQSYNSNKCYVVAYLYDANPLSPTYYEVLQVEEKKIK